MVAITSPLQTGVRNRRRRVRHKIQTPAYATFAGEQSSMLDLHEIVDISEDGMAIQCHSPLQVEQQIDLCLDLADCPQQIFTCGQVIWTNESGRAGLRFSSLPQDSLARLREWLFVNVMAGVANSEIELLAGAQPPRPGYTDTLAAVSVVQRQVETLGSDFAGALQLIAERTRELMHASGAAIALVDAVPDFMMCRASSGSDAPPVGARLQVGSGFSGECVKGGMPLRCDDTELDSRVDRESCRALGIRSILAAPVRTGEKSIGLVEVFSPNPGAFSEVDQRVLVKFADTVLQAAARVGRAEILPAIGETDAKSFVAPQGSVLFASADEEQSQKMADQTEPAPGISLPRSYLLLLTFAAGAISMALGFLTAPFVQSTAAPWIMKKIRNPQESRLQTVLASTKAPDVSSSSKPVIETATLDQLKDMAAKGNADAANAIGLRYATGEGVRLNEREAVRWFTQAAEQGNVAAQSKLGAFYYSGRGVPQDTTRAYFWMVVASLNGDEASKALAPHASARLTRAQIAAIEQNAARWLQQHGSNLKSIAAN
ncbi:MAG TPA: GAF domain-containing protein [Candidatus Sulfotelmatobacter sp.]|nr:GAF domain-containing protein [Candidatus Sulfotelmatobacter sp.]